MARALKANNYFFRGPWKRGLQTPPMAAVRTAVAALHEHAREGGRQVTRTVAGRVGRSDRAQLLYHVRRQRRHVQPQPVLAAEGVVTLREGAFYDLLGLGEHLVRVTVRARVRVRLGRVRVRVRVKVSG